MKKIGCILLILLLIMPLSFVSANQTESLSKSSIVTLTADLDTKTYANNIFIQHLSALLESRQIRENIGEYYLCEPISIFNTVNNTYSFCFPVKSHGEIKFILDVTKVENEFVSSLSTSFSKQLQLFLESERSGEFILLTDGWSVSAFNGIEKIDLLSFPQEKINKSKMTFFINHYQPLLKRFTLKQLDLNTFIAARAPVNIKSQKILNVKGVSQGKNPWCWAATCAAIINYEYGYSLNASNVANYVYPKNPGRPGGLTEIKKAYNHWGLYPKQTDTIPFNTVKYHINRNSPLHLRLVGNGRHSIALIGYQEWDQNFGNSKILVLLEPNGGIRKSVTLNSNGNFSYTLGGDRLSWQFTLEF